MSVMLEQYGIKQKARSRYDLSKTVQKNAAKHYGGCENRNHGSLSKDIYDKVITTRCKLVKS